MIGSSNTKLNIKTIKDLEKAMNIFEANTFVIKPKTCNEATMVLFIMNRKL